MAENNARDGVLSPVSSADSKKSKSNVDNRVFERLSVSSVQYFAESLGYDTHFRKFLTIVTSDALCALTEDVNYRLRELAHKSVMFMRQRRGEKLTVGDVNEALKWSGTIKLLGHGSRAPPSLHFIKELNLFVPNEGVVDAPTLALASTRVSPDVPPVLTGHLLPSLFESSGRNVQQETAQLKDGCSRLIKRCLSCSVDDLSECLRYLREACSLHAGCSLSVISQLVPSILRSPGNIRLWYCLRQVIISANFSRDTDGLRLICQASELLTNAILNPDNDSGLSSVLDDFHYQFLATVSSKYDFLTSLRFGHALIRTLEKTDFGALPTHYQCRILRSLALSVDLSVVFSHFDLIIDRFIQVIGTTEFNDHDLHFGWKFLITTLVQHLYRCLPDNPSAIDEALSVLLRLCREGFGDALPLPLRYHGPKIERNLTEEKEVENLNDSKSGGQLLEEYWNSVAHEDDEEADEDHLVIDVKPTVITARKRKRRKEAADVFEIPKRLRLMHQRDIVFVFHHTQAVVRPLESSRNAPVGGGVNQRKNEERERKGDKLRAKVMKSRRKILGIRSRISPLIIDVSTIVL